VASARSVLVVDDDPDIRRIVGLALVNLGHFRVRLASGAGEALAMVDQERPDVVLLDVSMPLADGLQTLALLRAVPSMKEVPIAFLTAAVGESHPTTPRGARESIDALRRAGAADVIAKPFLFEDLCERVRRLLPQSGVV
jgi:CheY-like chemotaxis protein